MKTKLIILIILVSSFLIHDSSKAQMFWNQAASFTGINTSYVSVPNSASVNITGSFSIEAWINPTTLSGFSKGIMSKGSTLGVSTDFAVRVTVAGRITVHTDGSQRLISKSSTIIKTNTWTHVASTYNSSTSVYNIFINGVLDTSSTVPGSAPPSNTDSLFIGISGSTTPYQGKLDEVRLWNRSISATEVSRYFRTSLGAASGIYAGLVLSITFQDRNSSGTDFSVEDISDNGNNGRARNVTAVDQGNNPYSTIDLNESVLLDGNNDYLVCKDTSSLDANAGVTLECWVYPISLSSCRFISKGIAPASYALGYNGTIFAIINGTTITTTTQIPLNQWSHISFKYNTSGHSSWFLNGVFLSLGFNSLGSISNSSDSLYIGGSSTIADFNGYIDEVRITDAAIVNDTIIFFAYKSLDLANDPFASTKNISYNLDGLLTDNSANGGPKLILRGNARFSHPAGISGQPVSPINRSDEGSYYKGYYMKTANKNIPLTGSGGIIYDSLTINNDLSIADLNLFIALNHQRSQDLEITITGPDGDSLVIFDNDSTNSNDNNIITIFDDQADSSLINGRLTSFSPNVKPSNSLNSKFSSNRANGLWKIKINDGTHGNVGVLYEWGIQINNQSSRQSNLNVSALMQGFYNPLTNLMNPDTMKVELRNSFPPYAIQQTVSSLMDENGKGYFSYTYAVPFYVVLRHRNSIETWGVSGLSGDAQYDFMTNIANAFGSNEIQVDNSPTRFAIFGGDVNQDGTVDLTDIVNIFNDANAFVSGYVVTDVTGDDFVDLSDVTLTFNNSNAFVSVIRP